MNRIKNSFQCNQTLANLDSEDQINTCRICLEPSPREHPAFCKCRGHLQYIHHQCLIEWARRVDLIRDSDGNVYFNCDICRQKISVELQNNCSIVPFSKMCDKSRISTGQICSFLLTALVFFIVMGICLYFLILNGSSTFLLFLTIASGTVSLVALSVMIFKGCFECRQHISKIRPQDSRI